MQPQVFDALVEEVWKRLEPQIPVDLRAHFSRVRYVVLDKPDEGVLEELNGSSFSPDELCGLYIGVPLTEMSLIYPDIMPGRVYLFRTALLDEAGFDGSAGSLERVREQIAITLLHEVGHYFGLEEGDLERLGFG
jgi:predicted Zn-dependent protease with MMP-like domain